MSKTIYHDASGTPISAGSDVAILQSQGSRYCSASFASVDSVTSNVPVNLVPVYKAGDAAWLSGNYIVVPKDGRYIISAYPDYLRTSNLARRRTVIQINDIIASLVELDPLAGTTTTGAFSCNTTLLDLKAGDKVSIVLFQYGTTSSDGINAGGFFNVVLLETKVPDIAAPEAVDITNTLVWEPEFIPDATYTKAIRQGDKIHIKVYCQVNDTGIGSAQMFTIPNVTLYPHVATGFIEGTGVYPMNSSGLNNNTFYTGPDYSGAANMEMGDHFNAAFTVFIKS
jgi:hypothetical protein